MTILTANNLSKSFGEKLLFQNLSFGMEQGEKIGLIGRNGAGKSTILKIIASLETPDTGEVVKSNAIKIEFLNQTTEYEYEDTALDYVMSGLPEVHNAFQEYHELIERTNPNLERVSELTHIIDGLHGWDIESKAKQILQRVGITDFSKSLHSASGGEKKRIAIAKILISNPDLLILDEPTNHLDADTVQWLQNELSASNLSIIFVTHDRYFLDDVATRIIELDFEKLISYPGDYEDYLIQKQILLQTEKSTNEHNESKYRQELEWLSKGAKARRTKQKSRIDWAEKLKDDIRFVEQKKIKIELGKSFLGSKVIEMHNLGFEIEGRVLIDDFTYIAKQNDRIGIIGPNGSGKSTFLKIITDDIQPTKGDCKVGQTVKIGYFSQENDSLDDSKTVIGSLQEIAEFIKVGFGRDKKITPKELLDRFLFPRNRHNSYVHTLSGGEKKRLGLIRMLMTNPNVLLLDEPTNDFDIDTLNVLENYLDDFFGTLLIVSHDRAFLDRCVEFIWSFEGNGLIKEYPGNYSSYLEKKLINKNANKIDAKPSYNDNSKNNNKKVPNSNKLSYKEKRELEEIEVEINQLENRIAELNSELNAYIEDYKIVEDKSNELHNLNSKLDTITTRWLELSEKV
jgi:ATP-binding cassette subfamily F protein uup